MGSDGRVRSSNQAARALLGHCTGRSCSITVHARTVDGTAVCQAGCETPRSEGERVSRSAQGVLVRGKRHRVRCSPVGDETVVVIEPCIGADTWTETPTARECEVLMWIARGETDRMIAERFGLKTSTIRTHTERARRKLRASTRTQAVARAISLGLIQV